VTDIKTDSSSIAAHIPLFKQKIGPNKPLKAIIRPNHIAVTLGQFDCDLILDYTLEFSIYEDTAKGQELLYDEIRFITSVDISTLNDIVTMKVLEHKLNVDNKFSGKQGPKRNKMRMSKNDYREFVSTLGFSSKYFKDWINESVFKGGVKFPYHPEEFLTKLKIADKSAHMFFEI